MNILLTPHRSVLALLGLSIVLAWWTLTAVFTGGAAQAVPSQRATTTVRKTTTASTTARRNNPTATAAPSTIAAGAATSAPVSTTLDSSIVTTTLPSLLVAGPNNTTTGAVVTSREGVLSTGTALKLVISGLLGVALALLALTVAYWRHTRPGRRPPQGAVTQVGSGGTPPGGTPVAAHPPPMSGGVGFARPTSDLSSGSEFSGLPYESAPGPKVSRWGGIKR